MSESAQIHSSPLAILQSKIISGQLRFKVIWKGQPIQNFTWNSEKELACWPKILQEFKRRQSHLSEAQHINNQKHCETEVKEITKVDFKYYDNMQKKQNPRKHKLSNQVSEQDHNSVQGSEQYDSKYNLSCLLQKDIPEWQDSSSSCKEIDQPYDYSASINKQQSVMKNKKGMIRQDLIESVMRDAISQSQGKSKQAVTEVLKKSNRSKNDRQQSDQQRDVKLEIDAVKKNQDGEIFFFVSMEDGRKEVFSYDDMVKNYPHKIILFYETLIQWSENDIIDRKLPKSKPRRSKQFWKGQYEVVEQFESEQTQKQIQSTLMYRRDHQMHFESQPME